MRAAFPESTHVALLYARSTTRRSNQSAMEFGWSTWVASHPALPRCPQELVITSERGICFPFAITLSVLRLCAASQKQILGPSTTPDQCQRSLMPPRLLLAPEPTLLSDLTSCSDS